LVLLTSDEDVIKMADAFLGEKLVMLYTVSFANVSDEVVCPNVGEGEEGENSGDEERTRKVLNDPYWKAVMSDDDDVWDTVDEPVAGTLTRGGETSTFEDDWHDFIDFDVEAVGANDGDNGDEEGAHEEAAQPETTHVGGSSGPATSVARLLDDDEEDEVSSKLARSDISVTPPKSDEEYEVGLSMLLGLLSFKMWTWKTHIWRWACHLIRQVSSGKL
jgi:hypothetical protein